MNKRLSTEEIEKKASIKTTKLLLMLVGAITLVVGISYLFPKFTGIVLLMLIVGAFIGIIWSMIYLAVEQNIRHKEWDNWRRS